VLTRFAKYSPNAQAITYDPARVPVGADVAVMSEEGAGETVTVLAVRGLPANQQFGAHVHTNACGENPEAAGPHYQHQPDPKQPSVDPAYANPKNEIWLDFTTDATGFARSWSVVDWTFDNRSHKSIVIHEHHTATEADKAGQAGARLACINLY
jgi:Cu-Zn family superoxide dismutase